MFGRFPANVAATKLDILKFFQPISDWMTNFIFSCFWLHVLMFFRHAYGGFPEVFWGFVRTIFWAFFCGITNKLRDIFHHVFGNKSRHFWLDSETFSSRFIFVPLLSFFSHKHISALLSISAGSRSLNGGRLSLHDAAWRRSVPQTSSPFHFLFHIQPEWSKSFLILKWVSSLFTVCFVQTVKLRNFRPHWKPLIKSHKPGNHQK